jgi:hypothetical protein
VSLAKQSLEHRLAAWVEAQKLDLETGWTIVDGFVSVHDDLALTAKERSAVLQGELEPYDQPFRASAGIDEHYPGTPDRRAIAVEKFIFGRVRPFQPERDGKRRL